MTLITDPEREGLVAGRELDALVATVVMGDDLGHAHRWVRGMIASDGYGGDSYGWYCTVCEPGGPGASLLLTDPHSPQFADSLREVVRDPKPYSTDISAALEVVEEMQSRWWWFALETFPSPYGMNDGSEVGATFKPTGMPDQPRDDVRAWAETIPLAICRAALAATPEKGPSPSPSL